MDLPLWIWGILGGIAAEVLRWFRIRDHLHEGLPDWSKTIAYWIVTVFMIGIGGVLVLLYQSLGDVKLNELLAFNIGVSAPLLLASATSRTPPLDPGKIE
ncbi:MAG: hypothetical protein F4Z04_07455 [Acidobacteria bacterium]|nr:hypothetical protein [Acidobacteriota bacterium]